MTPAQRRKKLRDFKKKKTTKKLNIFLLFLLFSTLVIFGLYFFNSKHSSGNLKISMVYPDNSGNIVVATFSKKEKEITLIKIPQNTQLEVSRQLGSWKAKSLWQLGINEKYEGLLLQETITKNFHFPISIWADEKVSGFVSGNFIKLIKATIFPYKSNLSLGDRFNLFYISFGIQNKKISSFNLSEWEILKKIKLTDGEEGYVLSKDILPINIMSSFSEPINSDFGYLVQIVNATGSRSVAENIGKTIESMGFKITSIKEESSNNDIDCFIYGKDKEVIKKMSLIYSCSTQVNKNNDFDIVIKLGSKFLKRY